MLLWPVKGLVSGFGEELGETLGAGAEGPVVVTTLWWPRRRRMSQTRPAGRRRAGGAASISTVIGCVVISVVGKLDLESRWFDDPGSALSEAGR
jgi:hypothetical protein